MTDPVYILTAQLDADSFAWLDALRRAHFPPERNVLSAHLTMFHQLSPQQARHLQDVLLLAAAIPVQFDAVVFLGAGNAIRAASPALVQFRAALKSAIGGEMSRQDNQGWRPHVTVQNKVTAAAARALHAALVANFEIRNGSVTGLQLWEYLGGPWKAAQSLPFGAPPAAGAPV